MILDFLGIHHLLEMVLLLRILAIFGYIMELIGMMLEILEDLKDFRAYRE
jgi:hypothetical protein